MTPPPTPGRGRPGAERSRWFYVGAAAYTAVVVGMAAIHGPDWLDFAAELMTLPAGLVLFAGGAWIAGAVGSLLGPFGASLYYGVFAAVAIANAVIWYDVPRFRRRRRGRPR